MTIPIIQTENIVANYFEQHPKAQQLKLSKIQGIKRQIEKNFRAQKMFVLVDFTNDSIINMINSSPDIFDRKENIITMKSREKFNEKMSWYFDSKIDDTIKNTYLQLMKTLA